MKVISAFLYNSNVRNIKLENYSCGKPHILCPWDGKRLLNISCLIVEEKVGRWKIYTKQSTKTNFKFYIIAFFGV